MAGFGDRSKAMKAAGETVGSRKPEGEAEKSLQKQEALSDRQKALSTEVASVELEADEAKSALRQAEASSTELDMGAQAEMKDVKERTNDAVLRFEAAKKELAEIEAELRGPSSIESLEEEMAKSLVTDAIMEQVIPNKVLGTVIETAAPFVQDSIDKVTGEDESKKAKEEERRRKLKENE